jgi:O-antigen/teichoic acid export membrane protein
MIETQQDKRASRGGLRHLVLTGGAFLVGREFLSVLLSLIGVLVITRIIGPSAYGSYAAALAVNQYLVSLCQGGIGVYLIRGQDVTERQFHVASSLLLSVALVVFAIAQVSVPVISSWLNLAGFDFLLRTLLLSLPIQVLSTAANAKIERALDFRRIAMIELSGQLIYYAIAVPMALAGFGVWSLVSGWCIQQAVICALLHMASSYVPKPAWDTQIASDLARHSIGFSVGVWTWQLRSLINPLVVGHFLDARAVGYVSLTIRLVEMLTLAKAVVWRLSVAAFAKMQLEPKRLLSAVNYGMQLQTLAIAPPLLGFAWFGGWIIPLVFGPQWEPVIALFPFIALGYLVNAQFSMHSSALYVLHRNLDVFLFNLANLVIVALVSWIAVPKLGIFGYGWGEIAGFASYFLLHYFITNRLDSPDYRLVAIWCAGASVGLFWRYLGVWTICAPFVALLWPRSLRRLRWFWETLTSREPIDTTVEEKQ